MILFVPFPRRVKCAECGKELPPIRTLMDFVRFCSGICAVAFYKRAGLPYVIKALVGGRRD